MSSEDHQPPVGGTPDDPPASRAMATRWFVPVIMGVWFAFLLLAMGALWRYKLSPGAVGATPTRWPNTTSLRAEPESPTLVLFAHPRCPCTRASLSELRAVLSPLGGRVVTYVVFFTPEGETDDWSHTDTWRDAETLAGVHVVVDREGEEAARFGAKTSGHLVLYGARKNLLFTGGITSARGHAGSNPQEEKLIALIESEIGGRLAAWAEPAATSPVFGCPIAE